MSAPSDHNPAPSTQDIAPTDTPRSPEDILSTLDLAARRGKLPGFHAIGAASSGPIFLMREFGTPFESALMASASPLATGTRLTWTLRLQRKLPLLFLVVLVLTVWPGVWVTDSMLKTYFAGYDFATWKWYLPLTVPCVPWVMWTATRKSRLTAREEAVRLVAKVREVLDAPASRT